MASGDKRKMLAFSWLIQIISPVQKGILQEPVRGRLPLIHASHASFTEPSPLTYITGENRCLIGNYKFSF